MKKNLLLIVLSVLFVFLDTAFFSFVNLYGIRPYAVISLALAATITFSIHSGMAIAAIGGFVIDFICNPYLGLTSALYLIALVLTHLFLRRNRPKALTLFLVLTTILTSLDMLLCLLSNMFGSNVNMLEAMLLHSLPCAGLTSALAMLFRRAFMPMLKGQLEKA